MDNRSVHQKIKDARPPLREVAPLTAYICWGYVVANTILGIVLLSSYNHTVEISIANILTYQGWGVVFLTLGLSTATGVITNNWKFTRFVQLVSVTVKTVWTIALFFQALHTPPTFGILIVWVFFAYVQALTYIFFIPKAYYGIHGRHL